jgi:hypothetical protein
MKRKAKTPKPLIATMAVALLVPALAAQSQVEPKGESWKTWVLTNGSQLRLPPPDAVRSPIGTRDPHRTIGSNTSNGA